MENIQFERPSKFEDACREIRKEALTRVSSLALREHLTFHDGIHTSKVVARYKTLMHAFVKNDVYKIMDEHQYENESAQRAIDIGELCAVWHDVVQDVDVPKEFPEPEYISETEKNRFYGRAKKIRNRKIETNELASAEALIEFFGTKYPQFFQSEDGAQIKEIILATVPQLDKEYGVIQPNVAPDKEPRPSIFAHALALADLGGSGLDYLGQFVSDSDKLFIEDNLDIAEAIEKYTSSGIEIDIETQAYFKHRMLKWCEIQVNFPMQRKARIRLELEPLLGRRVDKFIEETFPYFDRSVDDMKQALESRKEMPFPELIKDMGYVKS